MRFSIFLLTICFFFSCAKIVPDITSNLVLSIPLDGTAIETVSNSIGTIHRAKPTTNRHNELNKAMLFSRKDSAFIDFGDLPNTSFPGNVFTISCWIYVSDTTNTLAVLSKRGPFGPFEYSIDNHFNHSVFDLDNWIENGSTTVYGIDPLKASIPRHLNSWHHIAYVADNAELRAYFDGNLQSGIDSRILNNSLSSTSAPFILGNGGGYNKNYYFNGAIDDLTMYNKALDSRTIKYLFEL